MTVDSVVGSLLRGLPSYVFDPPIETVVFGFGVCEDGQLGLDGDANVLTPKVVEALLGTRLRGRAFSRLPLIAGSRNSLAISAEGDVYSWGWNSRATLGHGHRDNIVPKPRRIASLRGTPIVQVALGGWHALYLDEDGRVWASGGDEYMQSGQGGKERDVLVPTLCLPSLRVCQVSAGGMHSLALTEDGHLWTWGEPWGAFFMTIDRTPRRIDVPRSSGDSQQRSFVAIACGAFHNLALTADGTVYSWGLNDYGQLGLGTTASVTAPQRIEEGLEGVTVGDLACGGWHSAVVTTTGEVYVFGRGEYGRLGLADRTGSSKLRPMRVTGLEQLRVVQVSCGGSHTLVVTEDGGAWAWGRGSFGRLGTGIEKDAYSPIKIKLPGGPDRWHVISVAAGGRHSLVFAVPDNGDLNERLGEGSVASRRSPIGLSPQPSSTWTHNTSTAGIQPESAGGPNAVDDTALVNPPLEGDPGAEADAEYEFEEEEEEEETEEGPVLVHGIIGGGREERQLPREIGVEPLAMDRLRISRPGSPEGESDGEIDAANGSTQIRGAASLAQQTVHGLRDDFLGDRA